MKKLILLFIIILLILSIAIFRVRDNQVAIIKKYNGQVFVKHNGLHFFIPFLERIYFIQLYKNYRVVEVPYFNNKDSYLLQLLVEFKINDAINYFKLVDVNSKAVFLEKFDDKIRKIVIKGLHKNIVDLNNSKVLFNDIAFDQMGVVINYIAIYNISNSKYEDTQHVLESLYNNASKIKVDLIK